MNWLIWHAFQQHAVARTRIAADEAQRDVDRAARRVQALEARVDQLGMVTQALWELLREQADLTDQQLLDRIEEIDLRDSGGDGKDAQGGAQCASCGRRSCRNHMTCMYCGHELEADSTP